jgi:putative transposase
MLTPSQFRHWCQHLQLPASTCEYLATQRVALPSRVVQGRANNVTGRYPSQKMGVMMQFESHTVELWALYLLDHDTEVLGEAPK